MTRKAEFLNRLRSDLEAFPGVTLPELSRKYAVPERTLFEQFRGKGADKVRKDCWNRLLHRIRSWEMITLRVRNDWALAQVTMPPESLQQTGRELSAAGAGTLLTLRLNTIDSIYFLEGLPGFEPTVAFCTRRGRCAFEISPAATETSLRLFQETREATCVGFLEGPSPSEERDP